MSAHAARSAKRATTPTDVPAARPKQLLARELGLHVVVVALFLVGTYVLIDSSYEFATADAGTYALKTRLLVQQHTFDLGGQAALSIGQLLVGAMFALLFGFSLWSLTIAVYTTVGACLVLFYVVLREAGVDHRLALIGSLALFVNPIGLRFVDWYLTEPFFFLFLLAALAAYAIGFRRGTAVPVLAAGGFATILVVTRQFGIFLPLATIALLITRRRDLRRLAVPILVSAVLPLLVLGSFYLLTTVKGDYWRQELHMHRMMEPATLVATLVSDAFVTLEYLTIYALPIYLLVLVVSIGRRRLRDLVLQAPYALGLALAAVVGWTAFRYVTARQLMPYKASVFDINKLVGVWGFRLGDPWYVSLWLTIACVIGATLLLSRILVAAFGRFFMRAPHDVPDGPVPEQLVRSLLWWCAAFCFLVTSGTGLFYDRHIFPLAIFAIAFLVCSFPWIAPHRYAGMVLLLAVYAVFIYDIKRTRLGDEAIWRAANRVVASGVPPIEVNGGLGFNYYQSFHQIEAVYGGLPPYNWHKHHPLATYFAFTNKSDGDVKGLELAGVETDQSRWPMFQSSVYVFRRTPGFSGPIFPQSEGYKDVELRELNAMFAIPAARMRWLQSHQPR